MASNDLTRQRTAVTRALKLYRDSEAGMAPEVLIDVVRDNYLGYADLVGKPADMTALALDAYAATAAAKHPRDDVAAARLLASAIVDSFKAGKRNVRTAAQEAACSQLATLTWDGSSYQGLRTVLTTARAAGEDLVSIAGMATLAVRRSLAVLDSVPEALARLTVDRGAVVLTYPRGRFALSAVGSARYTVPISLAGMARIAKQAPTAAPVVQANASKAARIRTARAAVPSLKTGSDLASAAPAPAAVAATAQPAPAAPKAPDRKRATKEARKEAKAAAARPRAFSVGRQRLAHPDQLRDLMTLHDVSLIVDVRDRPRKAAPWSREALSKRFGAAYVYRADLQCGVVTADSLAWLATQSSVLILGAAEAPGDCHRHHEIALALLPLGIDVVHLYRDEAVNASELQRAIEQDTTYDCEIEVSSEDESEAA